MTKQIVYVDDENVGVTGNTGMTYDSAQGTVSIDEFKVGDLELSGDLSMDGRLYLNTGQIKFPAIQDESSGVNILDDYQEGTFYPTLTIGGATIGISYHTRLGSYTKIGNTVFYEIDIELQDKGSQTGDLQIENLPYPLAGGNHTTASMFAENLAHTYALNCYLTGGAAHIRMGEVPHGGSMVRSTDVNLKDDTRFRINGHYHV